MMDAIQFSKKMAFFVLSQFIEDSFICRKLKESPNKVTAWSKFVASVRARLTVAQVVEQVRANAELTFDFCMLLIVAG